LPNAKSTPQNTPKTKLKRSLLQKLLEVPLRGKVGDALESWAMNFQFKKITSEYGTGQEAKFSAELCQGNFDNHRYWTDQSFHERLAFLEENVIHD
jgi:hypothetical protein